MSADILAVSPGRLRGTDGNSLLRLLDQARAIEQSSPSKLQRLRAGRAVARVARELRRRGLATDPARAEWSGGGGGAAVPPGP